MNFSENLLSAMKSNNMTQKELAERVGVTEATLSRYVNGEREPKADIIANLATVLSTTSDFLLGIEKDNEFDISKVTRILARNANVMSNDDKRKLLDALFGEV